MIPQIKQGLIAIYLDYVNNYLTISKFAEDYSLTVDQARLVLQLGKSLHEEFAAQKKDAPQEISNPPEKV